MMDVKIHISEGRLREYPGVVGASFEADYSLIKVVVDDSNIHWYNMSNVVLVEVFDHDGLSKAANVPNPVQPQPKMDPHPEYEREQYR